MRSIRVKNKMIGDGYPAFIVAEMACSHDGSIEIAKKIIDAAAKARADAINFQMTSLPDYMVPNYSAGGVSHGKGESDIYGYLKKIFWFGETEWKELFDYANEKDLIISVTCNDIPSAKLAKTLGADIYQIHSSSLSEENLVKTVARIKKPICLKIGGTFLGELEKAIFWIREEGNEEIMLLHGFQNYPTKLKDVHLRFIPTLKKLFSLPVGFADHTDGGSELALVVPLLALPLGANFIEKHLTHDRSQKCEDFESALNPEDFKKFVNNVREVEKTFGEESMHIFSKDELKYRQISKKRAVANRDIGKGEILKSEDIVFKRSDEGIFPDESKFVIGRKLKFNIKENDPITWDSFE